MTAADVNVVGGIIPNLAVAATIVVCFGAVWTMYLTYSPCLKAGGVCQFIDFPGVIDGEWQKNLKYEFQPRMNFSYSFNNFKDGLLEFFWIVQPDGRYYADDDGFGMEDDIEIVLKSHLDKNGVFIEPFAPVK